MKWRRSWGSTRGPIRLSSRASFTSPPGRATNLSIGENARGQFSSTCPCFPDLFLVCVHFAVAVIELQGLGCPSGDVRCGTIPCYSRTYRILSGCFLCVRLYMFICSHVCVFFFCSERRFRAARETGSPCGNNWWR